jgi:hypothetical protein
MATGGEIYFALRVFSLVSQFFATTSGPLSRAMAGRGSLAVATIASEPSLPGACIAFDLRGAAIV